MMRRPQTQVASLVGGWNRDKSWQRVRRFDKAAKWRLWSRIICSRNLKLNRRSDRRVEVEAQGPKEAWRVWGVSKKRSGRARERKQEGESGCVTEGSLKC